MLTNFFNILLVASRVRDRVERRVAITRLEYSLKQKGQPLAY